MTYKDIFAKFKLILTLLAILVGAQVFGPFIPVEIKAISYAISLSMKTILIFVLPFLIFGFLMHALISLGNGAIVFIAMLLSMVACSNFIAIMTGYTIGVNTLPLISTVLHQPGQVQTLVPTWSFSLGKIISNEVALTLGVVLGVIFSVWPNPSVKRWAGQLHKMAAGFLRNVFLPLLPLFLLGFVFKIEHEQLLANLFTSYAPVLAVVVSSQVLYTSMLYFIAAGFNPHKFSQYMRNILPATITGFSTISSAATMPVTMACTLKNLNQSRLAEIIIPATANIHTLGSALGATILSLGTMLAFGHELPTLGVFTQFALYYMLAKFAVAGVPGGVILVITPLLEVYLGFTSDMVGLVTAVYLLFDPFGTATNVTCNGAFAILFSKIYKGSLDVAPVASEKRR